jgi:hypothetical protein
VHNIHLKKDCVLVKSPVPEHINDENKKARYAIPRHGSIFHVTTVRKYVTFPPLPYSHKLAYTANAGDVFNY